MYDPQEIKKHLKRGLKEKVCIKHPLSIVIKTADDAYVLGWNGPPTRGTEDHIECLRKGYASGEGMELCPTTHAETKAIAYAARKKDIGLENGMLFMAEWFPCDNCAKEIIQAGIIKIVTPDELYLDKKNHVLIEKLRNQSYNFEMSEKLIRKAGIEIIVDPLIKP